MNLIKYFSLVIVNTIIGWLGWLMLQSDALVLPTVLIVFMHLFAACLIARFLKPQQIKTAILINFIVHLLLLAGFIWLPNHFDMLVAALAYGGFFELGQVFAEMIAAIIQNFYPIKSETFGYWVVLFFSLAVPLGYLAIQKLADRLLSVKQ